MEQYLKTAYEDQDLEKYHSQFDFLDNNKYNSPWLNRVELRIGTEDANWSMDEFRLRLSPTNPSEIKANKIYHKKHISSINAEYAVALNKALKNRYQLLLDHYYLSNRLMIMERLYKQNLDLIKSLNRTNIDDFDADDLVSVESDLSDLMISIEELKMDIHETEFFMALDLPSASEIDWSDLSIVSVDQIKNFLDNTDSSLHEDNIYITEAEQDLILNQQMLKINKSEARSNIGYLQGNFDTNRGDDFQDHFGVQVGVRLPIVNPDKPDLNRDKFDLIEDEKEVDETKSLITRRSELLTIRLNHLFDQFDLLSERIEQSSKIISSRSLNGTINVFEIMKRKNYQVELYEKQLRIRRDIIDAFLDYLDIKGDLVDSPLKNYMSSTFEFLEE
jgi:hypothetical protein